MHLTRQTTPSLPEAAHARDDTGPLEGESTLSTVGLLNPAPPQNRVRAEFEGED
jgi:hypothetical protein